MNFFCFCFFLLVFLIICSSCLTSSQDSYTTDSQYTSCGYCHLFLKDGRCRFGSRCRYKHAGRDTVPLNVLEKVVVCEITLHHLSYINSIFSCVAVESAVSNDSHGCYAALCIRSSFSLTPSSKLF